MSVVLVRGPLVLRSSGRLSIEAFINDKVPILLEFTDDNDVPLAIDTATLSATLSQFGTTVTSGISPTATYPETSQFLMVVTLPSTPGLAKLTVTRVVGSTDTQTAEISINVKAK